MSILSDIMNILSGAAKHQVPTPSSRARVALETGAVTPPPEREPVNINGILTELGHQTGATDWQHSIVDLLKCFKVDASLENRVELARELGYQGTMDAEHTAEMNMWLHKELMANIIKHGGQLKL